MRLSCKCYQSLLRQVLNRVKLRSRVDAFHLSLAFLTAGHKELVLEPPAECHPISPVGGPWCLGEGLQLRKGFCQPSLRQVLGRFQGLSWSWYRVFSPGDVRDILDRALLGVCFGDGHFASLFGRWSVGFCVGQ